MKIKCNHSTFSKPEVAAVAKQVEQNRAEPRTLNNRERLCKGHAVELSLYAADLWEVLREDYSIICFVLKVSTEGCMNSCANFDFVANKKHFET